MKSLKLNLKSNFILFHILKKINPIICIYVKVIPMHATHSLSLSAESKQKQVKTIHTLERVQQRQGERKNQVKTIHTYREYSKGRESGGERERETLHVTKPIWPLSFLCILKSLNFRFRVIILKTKVERGRQDFLAGLIMLMHYGFGS